MTLALGIDVGGTFTKMVVVTATGEVVGRHRTATDSASVATLSSTLLDGVRQLEGRHGGLDVLGVASPGLVRPGTDVVHWMQGRMGVVQGLDWRSALGRRSRVPVLNDAQAALLGEVWVGAGVGCREVVMLTLGTGVGGAVLARGQLLAGHTGRAGHLGHIALQVPAARDIVNTPGSLEAAIGDCTVAARSGGRFTSTHALVQAHRAGDAEARDVWHASVQRLAAGLASIVNAFDPARIILGGGVAAHAWDVLTEPLRAWMDEYEWRPDGLPTPIVPAHLGDDAGAIGAARYALLARQ